MDVYKFLPGTDLLHKATTDYVQAYNITIRNQERFDHCFADSDYIWAYYNNFELVSMTFFRRPEVTHWTKYIMNSLGTYRHRWGDAPLRYITLALFATDDQVSINFKLVP